MGRTYFSVRDLPVQIIIIIKHKGLKDSENSPINSYSHLHVVDPGIHFSMEVG